MRILARLRGSLRGLRPWPLVSKRRIGWGGGRDYAQIAEQPIDVEQRASVRIVHTSYDALGIRVQKSDRAHRGRGCESARGTRMPTKRCVQLPPAVRMRGKKRMQHSRGIERSGGREV